MHLPEHPKNQKFLHKITCFCPIEQVYTGDRQKSVFRLVACTLLALYFYVIEFTKSVGNEVTHVSCTTWQRWDTVLQIDWQQQMSWHAACNSVSADCRVLYITVCVKYVPPWIISMELNCLYGDAAISYWQSSLCVYLQRSTQLTLTHFTDHFSSEMTNFYQVRSTQLICSLLQK